VLLIRVYVVVCVQPARQATNSTGTCLDRQSEKEMAFHGVDRPAGGRAAYFLLVFNEFAQRTTEMFEGKD